MHVFRITETLSRYDICLTLSVTWICKAMKSIGIRDIMNIYEFWSFHHEKKRFLMYGYIKHDSKQRTALFFLMSFL